MRSDRKAAPKKPLLSTLTVEATAAVAGHQVLLGVGLGHIERTEDGKRICMELAAAPYDRKLYIWLRDVHRLEVEDLEQDQPEAPLPH